jgi:hypothetical protein
MPAIHSGTREIERSKNRIINENGILDGPDARNNALCDGIPANSRLYREKLGH